MWGVFTSLIPINTFSNPQAQHDEIEAKFFEERAALEAKYQKLYEPLYSKVKKLEYNNLHIQLSHNYSFSL